MKPYYLLGVVVAGACAAGPAAAQLPWCAGIPASQSSIFVATGGTGFVGTSFSFFQGPLACGAPCWCCPCGVYPPWCDLAPWAVPPWQEPFALPAPIVQRPLIVQPAPQPIVVVVPPLRRQQPGPNAAGDPQANQPPDAMRGFGELADEEEPPQGKGTSPQAVRRAGGFVRQGDEQFARQKYAVALARYKTAAQASPKLAEVWLRQGIAQTALGKYDLAAAALRRAVALDPRLSQLDFKLDQLYGDNRLAKAAHLDALAQRAIDQPHDGDLYFVLAVFLHFDGQPQRAQKFFQRAHQLTLGDRRHLAAFLDQPQAAAQAARAPAAGGREL